jgi:hypothetical protein
VYGNGGRAVSGTGVVGTGNTGVYGTGTSWGFATDSNVQQARTANGWAKAMVYVNASQAPYKIVLCYNAFLAGAAATTPPCGFDLEEVRPGRFTIDFGFEVDDRFLVSSLAQVYASEDSVQFTTGTIREYPAFATNNRMVMINTQNGATLYGMNFYLSIF